MKIITWMIQITFLLFGLVLLTACQASQNSYGIDKYKHPSPFYHGAYVDFEKFKEGRLCSEVRFECLPESKDPSVTQKPLANGVDSLTLNSSVMKKYKRILADINKNYRYYHKKKHLKGEQEPMHISELDQKFFDAVREKRFLREMEQDLEKEFPGFWRDTPLKVRYRWIQRAMNKAKVFGYDPKQNNAMVELCARIGLNFDKDPKWEAITKFVAAHRFNIGAACDYIDFTVFEKDYSPDGDKYTDWYLREALGSLPYPKRPVPRLGE